MTPPPSQPPNPRHQGQGFVSLFLCGFGSCSHSCCEVKCVITLSCLANIILLHVSPATGYYNLGTPPHLVLRFQSFNICSRWLVQSSTLHSFFLSLCWPDLGLCCSLQSTANTSFSHRRWEITAGALVAWVSWEGPNTFWFDLMSDPQTEPMLGIINWAKEFMAG